jgi:hypothetical protein
MRHASSGGWSLSAKNAAGNDIVRARSLKFKEENKDNNQIQKQISPSSPTECARE